LEFGLTSSTKSYIVPREAHSNGAVTKNVKSSKEGNNAKFESKLNGKGFNARLQLKQVYSAKSQ
jgi:hypothetical protein